ncbi:hypothetical protein ACJJIR_07665 [Microbulbifer sp. SSSA008]|uniref:hypothetical protein n=1 Tax=Microbulbifer sp. SSSA008 TaxID=3243380 RepID=UPI004039D426
MDISWQGLIAGAIAFFVVLYERKRSVYAEQEGVLKSGLITKGFGLVTLLFSVVPFGVFLTGNYQVDKPGETIALIGLTLSFGIAAIYYIAEGFFVKGAYNDTSIVFVTPWAGKKDEKWCDLESVEFNCWWSWYVL